MSMCPLLVPTGYSQQLALKGCSNINDAACNQLSKGNVTVGDIIFRNLTCNDSGPGLSQAVKLPWIASLILVLLLF